MAKQSDKSYRKPYINMKVKAGPLASFNHTAIVESISGDDIVLRYAKGRKGTITNSLTDYTEWLNTGWREPVFDFNDYLKQCEL